MKEEIMSVQENSFKFTELSRDASEMVADMGSRMSLFVFGRSRLSNKKVSGHAPNNNIDHRNQNFRAQATQSRGSVVQGATWTATYAKYGRNHLGFCCDGSNGCFKCGQTGYFMRYSPKNMQGNGENIVQSSSVTPTDRADPRG
ncbi:uncharacterized protein LOC125861573 [Solanum stenotomum]|uniref:uncharacterized protein LOC125861573 n=1 Tax=Solanum stenotomum TaxID=172797 RepID=UPI0020D07A48|nr:uncharacterized protein LOC125861573 [Solanum stenotomum]